MINRRNKRLITKSDDLITGDINELLISLIQLQHPVAAAEFAQPATT